MALDFSNFAEESLRLVESAHGVARRFGCQTVDSLVLLWAYLDKCKAEAEALLAKVSVDAVEFSADVESVLKRSGGYTESVACGLAGELERVFVVAGKIAAKCKRQVLPIDILCALGVVKCQARRLFEKYGINAEKLDVMYAAWENGESCGTQDTTDYLAKLDGLVGLTSVKDEVRKLADMVRFNAERIKNGLSAERLTDNFVFRGNPGTGKTEVARIIAGIYKQFGALKKGHLVEVDRSRLIAGYVGQSEDKTEKVIDSALDGVLFIDEAYALAQGGRSDYGAQVASVLVKRMEDDRNRLVVIAAGYADEMDKFIGMNPGFSSRFTKYIDFPDYTGEELTRIFEVMAKAEDYECTKDAMAVVRKKMDSVAGQDGRTSGNARSVRNLLKAVKERMASRVLANGKLTREKLRRIEVEDIG